jgi:asparagine synthase (glutamine-hydrolysing)
LVQEAGIKVVLTGEGADEMFAGYDIFREAKVRRFWGRHPQSSWRGRLIERLYPYLTRSPVRQRALSQQFFGQDLADWSRPGFGHRLRWRGTSALKRLFTPGIADAVRARDAEHELLADLPIAFKHWSRLAQDQYLEVRTLLAGYLLSSQGDRMLMAHSVEGRFPFLDRNVAALAESLPASYKLHVLDEKHVLKRMGRDLLPPEILARTKQPYRAPDALSFSEPEAAGWIEEVGSRERLTAAGVFNPDAARRLIEKCLKGPAVGQFSNADNMALVGVLSTQLVHHQMVVRRPSEAVIGLTTLIDRVAESPVRP